jgi:carbon storage regulator
MLVLTRREGDAIIIDGDIRVVILSTDRRGVRIGIEAPAARTVVREELLREVADANQRASDAGLGDAWMPSLTPAPAAPVLPAPRPPGDSVE